MKLNIALYSGLLGTVKDRPLTNHLECLTQETSQPFSAHRTDGSRKRCSACLPRDLVTRHTRTRYHEIPACFSVPGARALLLCILLLLCLLG